MICPKRDFKIESQFRSSKSPQLDGIEIYATDLELQKPISRIKRSLKYFTALNEERSVLIPKQHRHLFLEKRNEIILFWRSFNIFLNPSYEYN